MHLNNHRCLISVSWVRSLLTSFCVNLCHLIVSLQQSVIQSVSSVLSQKIWINTQRSQSLL
ncbi:hypothetical protein [Coleofasciculus chthonoplastes]|uniref:hypothetical protein n=1 Tax=Coleofasciculus chthonoplastes TaxID=64178 RepID=UPI003300B521